MSDSFLDRLVRRAVTSKLASGGMDRFGLADGHGVSPADSSGSNSPDEAGLQMHHNGDQEYSAPDAPALEDLPVAGPARVGPPPASQMQPDAPPPPPSPPPMPPAPPGPQQGPQAPAPMPAPMPSSAPQQPVAPAPKTASFMDRMALAEASRRYAMHKKAFTPSSQAAQGGLTVAQPAQQPPAAAAIAGSAPAPAAPPGPQAPAPAPSAAPPAPAAQPAPAPAGPPAVPTMGMQTTSSMPMTPMVQHGPSAPPVKSAASRWRTPQGIEGLQRLNNPGNYLSSEQHEVANPQFVNSPPSTREHHEGRWARRELLNSAKEKLPQKLDPLNRTPGFVGARSQFGLDDQAKREIRGRLDKSVGAQASRTAARDPAVLNPLKDVSQDILAARQSGGQASPADLNGRRGMVDEIRSNSAAASAKAVADRQANTYPIRDIDAKIKNSSRFSPFGNTQTSELRALEQRRRILANKALGLTTTVTKAPAASSSGFGGLMKRVGGMMTGKKASFMDDLVKRAFGPPQPGGSFQPQDEQSLRADYERRKEQILAMAGQADPHTGRPYGAADVDRQMKQLNADATRSLQAVRHAQSTYGGASHPGQPAFGPQPVQSLYGPSPMHGAYGHPMMPGGFGQPMMGGGMLGYGMPPILSQQEPDQSEPMRQRVEEMRQRQLAARLDTNETRHSQPGYEDQLEKVRQLARQTTSTGAYNDPDTGRPIEFGGGLSQWLVGSGETWGGSNWKDFMTEYNKLQAMKKRQGGRDQVVGQYNQRADQELLGRQRRLDQEEAAHFEDRNMRRNMQRSFAQRMMPPAPPGQPQPGAAPQPAPQQGAAPPSFSFPQPPPAPGAGAAPSPAPQAAPQAAPQPPAGGRQQIQFPPPQTIGAPPEPSAGLTDEKFASVRFLPLTVDDVCLASARHMVKRSSAHLARAGASAKKALTSAGLLSDRDSQKTKQRSASAAGASDGLAGLAGASVGAAGGAGLGAAGGYLTGRVAPSGRPGSLGRSLQAVGRKHPVSMGAAAGGIAGGLAGLLGGTTIGVHNGYVRGRDANAPTNTLLERAVPSLNPLEKMSAGYKPRLGIFDPKSPGKGTPKPDMVPKRRALTAVGMGTAGGLLVGGSVGAATGHAVGKKDAK